jgi:phosphatidate cytidylyltransferase
MKSEFLKRIASSAIIVPLSLFFIIKGSFLFISFICFCFLISLYEWFKMISNKFILTIGFFFLTFSFYSVLLIRNDLNENNLFNFLILIIICVSTDLGGYFFGKTFKGPKLTKISPNKTYSGAIGGFVFAIILTVIFVIFIYKFFYIKIELSSHFILMILFLSLVSQLGDLAVSYFKRKSNIQNTGDLIPGHGGILDRIDGMIFVFPVFYIIDQFFYII